MFQIFLLKSPITFPLTFSLKGPGKILKLRWWVKWWPLFVEWLVRFHWPWSGLRIRKKNTKTSTPFLDCLTSFERILHTPIPLAYSIHLTQTVAIYCITFPFQFIRDLGYTIIPVTAIIVFTLFGVLAIGEEIENPFGLDYNDLRIDYYCQSLRHEIEKVLLPFSYFPPWFHKINFFPFSASISSPSPSFLFSPTHLPIKKSFSTSFWDQMY